MHKKVLRCTFNRLAAGLESPDRPAVRKMVWADHHQARTAKWCCPMSQQPSATTAARPVASGWREQERPTASRRTAPLSNYEGLVGAAYDGSSEAGRDATGAAGKRRECRSSSFLLLLWEKLDRRAAPRRRGVPAKWGVGLLGPPHSSPSLTPSLTRGEGVSEGTSLNNRRCNTGHRRARCRSGRSGPGSGRAVRRGAAAWWPGR